MSSSFAGVLPRWFITALWGNTVALSWMWGLGLFFSVQFSAQFGLFGLLSFAIPNAIGLWAFGLITHHLARREPGSETLARFFNGWSRPFRLVFFLYQLLAITLTIFAFIRYAWQPLGLQPEALYLPLTLLVGLAAAILFGEEFNIRRIKWSHGVIFLILLAAVIILLQAPRILGGGADLVKFEPLPTNDLNYWGYAVAIIIGFLLGPWLDLQQWQRAIQMHRERISIAGAYAVGSLQFFLLLIFHGTLALWALGQGAGEFLRTGLGGHPYHHDSIMHFLVRQAGEHPWLFGAYCVFLAGCLLTTLDSGYIALRWFLQTTLRASNNALLAIIPQGLLTSPIPIFGLAGLVALLGAVLNLEIEYFMIFYATFFVGYSGLAIARCYVNTPANVIPQVKMFCIGSLAVVIFAYGYFLRYPIFMIIGSMLPLIYLAWTLLKPTSGEEFVSGTEELSTGPAEGGHRELTPHRYAPGEEEANWESSGGAAEAAEKGGSIARMAAPALAAIESLQNVGGHFEGKWFVHSFVSTYADTNSVGNVYFGMYAMWVGKTRELFFNKVMPKFNLKNTPFYILTRSFEHKFIRETREFETVSVRIRIASYNRKFVVLEHEIYDSGGRLLGKGKQSLLFVSSSDYRMIDLPPDVTAAFIAHT